MKLPVIVLVLFVMFGAQAQSQTPGIQLEERSLLGNKVSLLLPKQFGLMGEEMLKLKYPTDRRPAVVYTNDDGTVDVALNHTNNRVTLSQLPELHKVVENTFKNLYPSATWFRNEILEINGRNYFLLDLRTPGVDTEIRNIMLGTSLEGRFLIISFNATKNLESAWVPVGNKIIQSVKIQE